MKSLLLILFQWQLFNLSDRYRNPIFPPVLIMLFILNENDEVSFPFQFCVCVCVFHIIVSLCTDPLEAGIRVCEKPATYFPLRYQILDIFSSCLVMNILIPTQFLLSRHIYTCERSQLIVVTVGYSILISLFAQIIYHSFGSLCFETSSCCKCCFWSYKVVAASGGSQCIQS